MYRSFRYTKDKQKAPPVLCEIQVACVKAGTLELSQNHRFKCMAFRNEETACVISLLRPHDPLFWAMLKSAAQDDGLFVANESMVVIRQL
jgi:hypothetical protein